MNYDYTRDPQYSMLNFYNDISPNSRLQLNEIDIDDSINNQNCYKPKIMQNINPFKKICKHSVSNTNLKIKYRTSKNSPSSISKPSDIQKNNIRDKIIEKNEHKKHSENKLKNVKYKEYKGVYDDFFIKKIKKVYNNKKIFNYYQNRLKTNKHDLKTNNDLSNYISYNTNTNSNSNSHLFNNSNGVNYLLTNTSKPKPKKISQKLLYNKYINNSSKTSLINSKTNSTTKLISNKFDNANYLSSSYNHNLNLGFSNSSLMKYLESKYMKSKEKDNNNNSYINKTHISNNNSNLNSFKNLNYFYNINSNADLLHNSSSYINNCKNKNDIQKINHNNNLKKNKLCYELINCNNICYKMMPDYNNRRSYTALNSQSNSRKNTPNKSKQKINYNDINNYNINNNLYIANIGNKIEINNNNINQIDSYCIKKQKSNCEKNLHIKSLSDLNKNLTNENNNVKTQINRINTNYEKVKNNVNALLEKFKKDQKITGNLKIIKSIKNSEIKDNNNKQTIKFKNITQSKSYILNKKNLMEKKTDNKIYKNFVDGKNIIFDNIEKEGKMILEDNKIIKNSSNNNSNKNIIKYIDKELNENNKIIQKKEKNEEKLNIKSGKNIEKQIEKNIEKQIGKGIEKQNEKNKILTENNLEKQSEKNTEKQIDKNKKQTEKNIEKQNDKNKKQIEKNIEKLIDKNNKQIEKNIEKQIEKNKKSTEKNIEKQIEKNIGKQSDKNIIKQSDKNIEKQSDKNIEKQSDKNINKSIEFKKIEIRDSANKNQDLIEIKKNNNNYEKNNNKKESENKNLIPENDKKENIITTNIEKENKNKNENIILTNIEKENKNDNIIITNIENDKNENIIITKIENENEQKISPSPPPEIKNNIPKNIITNKLNTTPKNSSSSLKKEEQKENIQNNKEITNNQNTPVNNNDSISNNNKETNIPTNTPENEDPEKFLSIELVETQNIIIGTNPTLNKNSKNEISFNYSESPPKNYSDFPEMLCEPKNKNKSQNENNTKSLLTTQSRDCSYYQSEYEKLTNNIKKYYNENKSYPDSNINFYLYGRQIGHGAFGKVNLALHIASGRLVAMKTFIKKELKYKEAKEKIKNEIEVLSKLKHIFINQILDSFETDEYIFIFMEYICGDLLSFIRKRSKLSEKICQMLFKEIIIGLQYIHKKNIVHRDIKLDNILIDLNNTIKICDFGVSRKVTKGVLMYERCGTPAYIAPEIFIKDGYEGFECDIWSAGVTLYYMLSGTQPFKGRNIQELEKNILAGEFEKIEDVSDEANDLILGMLQVDPIKRLNCEEILKHPWLKNVNINERFKVNFFSENEKNLLKKYDVDYLNSSNNDLIENFTYRNLNVISEKKKIVGNTKSIIYAPYNSCVNNSMDNESENSSKNVISYLNSEEQAIYDELKIENDICKFGWRTKQPNINYELSNNDDFDNGLMKSKKEVELMNKNEELNREYRKNRKNRESFSSDCEKVKIDKSLVEFIEKNIGYDKKYLVKCLKKNVVNYCTATYYLLAKDKEKECDEDKNE